VLSFSRHSLGIQSCPFEFPRCLVIVTDFWSWLHPQYCETGVITVVPYSGAMTRDHDAASEPRVSCVSESHKFLLGTCRYRGLWSWSIFIPTTDVLSHLNTLRKFMSVFLLNFWNPLLLATIFLEFGCNLRINPVVLWTPCWLMCLTHFLFHYSI
jgi:hypothetical protein